MLKNKVNNCRLFGIQIDNKLNWELKTPGIIKSYDTLCLVSQVNNISYQHL